MGEKPSVDDAVCASRFSENRAPGARLGNWGPYDNSLGIEVGPGNSQVSGDGRD